MFNIPDLLFNFPGFSVHLPPDWAFKILRITHDWMESPQLRMECQAGLNKGEARDMPSPGPCSRMPRAASTTGLTRPSKNASWR